MTHISEKQDAFTSEDLFRFEPDPNRAAYLDRRMGLELANSLDHVCRQCETTLRFDVGAMRNLVERLRNGERYPPSTFGLYYRLVAAVMDQDETQATLLLDRLSSETPLTEAPQILAMDQPGASWKSDLYRQLMDADQSTVFDFLPPDANEFESFSNRFNSGFSRLRAVMPELAGEVEAIVSEVVVAVGKPKSDYVFDGGSAFTLWGGLFLNARFHMTDMEIIEVIAHETAHSFLFGFCIDEPLVNNPDDQLYPSPLRVDDRPMDGIYHATFVSARMCWAMSRLLQAEGLTDEEREAAEKAIALDKANFRSGYSVIEEHGQLTGIGEALMDGAVDYMARA